MAAQENVVYPPPADVVGKAFARQYYAILETSPGLVHRFYQAVSLVGRPHDTRPGPMISAINAKIQSFGSLRADIKFVQAQDSLNGGVIVLVVGAMVDMDESRRDFTQTFFLAPQDKGYYIFNDIFRYLDDDSHRPGEQDYDIRAPTTPVPDQESRVSGQENGEVYNPSENGEVAIEEDEEPVAEVVDEAPSESQVVVEHSDKCEEVPKAKAEELPIAKIEELPIAKIEELPSAEAKELPSAKTEELPRATAEELPKKSYASIVMKDSPSPGPSPGRPKPMPLMQEQQVSKAPAAPSFLPPLHSSADSVDDGNNQEPEDVGHSIYIRNLPPPVTHAELEAAFIRFGPIKRNSIQIRFSKGGLCFGFLDFEEAEAVQSSIEASPVSVCGRPVIVEEKRSTAYRGNGRFRYPPTGRGGGFRSEGGRGRGSYGGRGYSQGEDSKNDFGNRRTGQGYYRGNGRQSRGSGTGISSAGTQRVSAEV